MLRIYDTKAKRLVEFKPLQGNKVGMYVCGVTVYDMCHVGHARSAVVFDVIYRYLKHKGYDVTFVKNFTDVDDKIIDRARKEGVETDEIAERYIREYYVDMDAIGVQRPDVEPRATKHIKEIVELIRKLVEKGYAYVAGGDVYYSVSKFGEYGKLSGKNIEELKVGARIEPGDKKRDPLDFALWKASQGEEPYWESPWGNGRPGWHIECSAMSMKYLGESFDIHGGGEDLIFPHHENEIAQSEAASGTEFVRYWVHNGFVRVGREKMSKSLGNFFTIRDILREFDGEVLRYFLLLTHYRNPVDFSFDLLKASREALNRFYNFKMRLMDFPKSSNTPLEDGGLMEVVENMVAVFDESMDYDFNTPKAIGDIFSVVKRFNIYLDRCDRDSKPCDENISRTFFGGLDKIASVLGVFGSDPRRWFTKGGVDVDWVESMIEKRAKAREERNFQEADRIREELMRRGVILEDTRRGTVWKVKI